LPAGAHDAGGGVGVGAEEEVAEFVGEAVTDDDSYVDLTGFMDLLGAIVEEVGVAAGTVGGEVRDAHGELVQIDRVAGDAELKVPGETSGAALGWIFRSYPRGRTVQPTDFEAGLTKDAGGFRFCLEQDSKGNARVVVDGYGDR
jgi:hypothetical protein